VGVERGGGGGSQGGGGKGGGERGSRGGRKVKGTQRGRQRQRCIAERIPIQIEPLNPIAVGVREGGEVIGRLVANWLGARCLVWGGHEEGFQGKSLVVGWNCRRSFMGWVSWESL
jgi:hypothetical protein